MLIKAYGGWQVYQLGAHHRFVNTTPNPSATKNKSGEDVGPPPPPLLVVVAAGDDAEVVEGLDIVDVGSAVVCVPPRFLG